MYPVRTQDGWGRGWAPPAFFALTQHTGGFRPTSEQNCGWVVKTLSGLSGKSRQMKDATAHIFLSICPVCQAPWAQF